MVWCGAILPLMHRHWDIPYDKTRARLWHKAYEHNIIKASSSDSVPSRAIGGLSGYTMVCGKHSTIQCQAREYSQGRREGRPCQGR